MTGAPRILDFGVARLIDPDRHTRSGQTIRGIRPLTPNYASPEQLAGGPLTTSTDIYSLGVVLYESLTGSVPFDHSDFPWMQISERIAEEAPALPSNARLSGACSREDAVFARQPRQHRIEGAGSRSRQAIPLDRRTDRRVEPVPGRRRGPRPARQLAPPRQQAGAAPPQDDGGTPGCWYLPVVLSALLHGTPGRTGVIAKPSFGTNTGAWSDRSSVRCPKTFRIPRGNAACCSSTYRKPLRAYPPMSPRIPRWPPIWQKLCSKPPICGATPTTSISATWMTRASITNALSDRKSVV